jgi:hypothetical protein
MTREEALKILKEPDRIGYNVIHANDEETIKYNTKSQMALNMAIKALEQEPVIDKIRAEIEQLTITEGGDDYVRKMAELFSLKMKVLHIIDKYKAESEDK